MERLFLLEKKNQKSKIRDFDRFILPFSLIFDTLLEALSPLQLNLMESVYKPFYLLLLSIFCKFVDKKCKFVNTILTFQIMRNCATYV